MKVLFAAGDVGGARSLLPVISICFERFYSFLVLQHGYISKEIHPGWPSISIKDEKSEESIENLLKKNNISVFAFASSVHDTLPLQIARKAKNLGIPVIHVLDNWTGYVLRMQNDNQPIFRPDYYTVIDDLAYQEAVKSGIEPTKLIITGQPALSSLWNDYLAWKDRAVDYELEKLGYDPKKKIITFVSEPVEDDQGASDLYASYRGYTEKTVLRSFCEALQDRAKEIQVAVLPHPRESEKMLEELWRSVRGALSGGILKMEKGRGSLFLSDGIAGMASILLYEAWLLGKPVISLQPEIRLEALRMFKKREGVAFVESSESLKSTLNGWLQKTVRKLPCKPRPEINMHHQAASNIFHLIQLCTDLKQ